MEDFPYQKVRLGDAGAALPGDFVSSGDVDDVDDVVCQLSAEVCGQVI